MGERADAMRAEGSLDDETRPSYAVDATSDDMATDTDDPEEIRDDIEQTRADMSETIDAITEKLNPERLAEQAKDAVREATVGRVEQAVSDASDSARDAGNSFVDFIKQNPVPTAMAAIGIGWLWRSRGNTDVHNIRHVGSSYAPTNYRTTHGYYGGTGQYTGTSTGSSMNAGRYGTRDGQYFSSQGSEDQGGGVGQMAGQATERVGEIAGQAKDQVSEFAGQAKDQVGEYAGQVQEQVGQFADQAQYQARRAQYQFQDTFRDNPLAVAALALGLGAAVGFAIPETEKEDRMFGDARDSVVDRAQTMAQETMDKVQSVMGEAKDAAQQAAQDEGLTGG